MTSLQAPTALLSNAQFDQPVLPTFMDHLQELRSRLFFIALVFVAMSGAAYPFKDAIIAFITNPLDGQDLFYLTPIGGFSFILKICMYVGALLTLPAIIYHLYKYIQPLMGSTKKSVLAGYVSGSVFLAALGASFAYFVSLPAALHFLTGFEIANVTAMLTVDSYFSFVVSYTLGAAALFQLPLVLLIINSVTPLSPGKLMKFQRHIVLGAFVAAAVISPTPDATNQALLAVPIIVMYQVGIVLVLIRNRINKPKAIKVVDKSPLEANTVDPILPTNSLRQKSASEQPHAVIPSIVTPKVALDPRTQRSSAKTSYRIPTRPAIITVNSRKST